MEDLYKIKRRLGIKDHATGPWMDGVKRHKLNEDGGVGFLCKCNHYDLESDFGGYCRDENCRRERFIQALHKGEAMMLPNGTIVWVDGVRIKKEK